MFQICEGLRSKREVLDESVEQYREVFARSRRDFDRIIAVSLHEGTLQHRFGYRSAYVSSLWIST